MLLVAVEDVEPGAVPEVEPVVPEGVPVVVPVVVPDVPEVVPVAEEPPLEAAFRMRSMAAMCISGSPVLVLVCVPVVD